MPIDSSTQNIKVVLTAKVQRGDEDDVSILEIRPQDPEHLFTIISDLTRRVFTKEPETTIGHPLFNSRVLGYNLLIEAQEIQAESAPESKIKVAQ